MSKIINLELLSHPANWVIIFLTLYFVALLAKTVSDAVYHGVSPVPTPFTTSGA